MRQATVTWIDRHGFRGETGTGHQVVMDTRGPDGDDRGPTPKDLVLLGLGGCTAVDVVDILRKMRQPVESFTLDLECEDAEEHPRVFRRVLLVYRFTGEGLDAARVRRAVELSMEKYCGVSAMVRHTADIQWSVEVNGRRTPQ